MPKFIPLLFLAGFALGCSFEMDCDHDAEEIEDVTNPGTRTEPCPEGSVCLDVTPLEGGSVRAGHLAVVWYQLDDADPDPTPEIGWSKQFGPRDKRIEISSADITPPSKDDVMLCERACDDEASCACRGETRVGIATIVAADDLDRDGVLEIEEVRQATYGRGYMVLGFSEAEHSISPPPFDQVFSDGIGRGVHAYRFLGNPEERLARSVRGESFALNVCRDSRSNCTPPFPALRSF